MTITILGTGAMGVGMTQSLRRADLAVTVWSRTPERAQPLAELGATVTTDPAQAVREADVVLTMLYDIDSTLDVARTVLPAMQPGAVWVQSATVGVEGTERVVALAAEHGVQVLDVPVLGSKVPAEQGSLVMLASGDPALRPVVQPYFDAMAARTMWVADTPGAGSRLKLVCNAWIGTLTAAVGQSMALARGLDLDPRLFLDAVGGGQADSPYLQAKGHTILAEDYPPQFSLDGVIKDQRLIRDAIASAGVSPALIDGVLSVFDAASERGYGADDMAAVVHGFDA